MLTPKERAARFIAWQRLRQADRELAHVKTKTIPSALKLSITEVDEILEDLNR